MISPGAASADFTLRTGESGARSAPVALRLGVLSMFLGFLLTGCGASNNGVKVSGKVVLPQDARLLPNDNFQLSLIAVGTPHSEAARIEQPELTFLIAGVDNRGVPPGKYKVEVKCQPYPSQDNKATKEHKKELDAQFGKFSGPKNVLPEIEITSGSAVSLTIDLEKKTVEK